MIGLSLTDTVPYRVRQKRKISGVNYVSKCSALANEVCMGRSVFQVAAKAGNSNRGTFFVHGPLDLPVTMF